MSVIGCKLMGRWGNQLFQYAFCRGYAESIGADFECQDWIGNKVFMLDDKPLSSDRRDANEDQIVAEELVDVNFVGYAQKQQCLNFYSREQARQWFNLRPEIREMLRLWDVGVAWHIRRGDYWHAGYPLIGYSAYFNAMTEHGIPFKNISVLSDSVECSESDLPQELKFLNDFYAMAGAKVLFRANSSFSWWAAALSNSRVFSPVIDGLRPGVLHDHVHFVEGNYPRPANLQFITDLHLQ